MKRDLESTAAIKCLTASPSTEGNHLGGPGLHEEEELINKPDCGGVGYATVIFDVLTNQEIHSKPLP